MNMMPPTRPCRAQLNETRSDLAGSRELTENKEESETNSSKSLVQEWARVQLKKYFAHIHVMGKTSADLGGVQCSWRWPRSANLHDFGSKAQGRLPASNCCRGAYVAFLAALTALSSPLSAKAKSVSAAWAIESSMFLASSPSGRPSTQLVTSPLCGGRPMPMRRR